MIKDPLHSDGIARTLVKLLDVYVRLLKLDAKIAVADGLAMLAVVLVHALLAMFMGIFFSLALGYFFHEVAGLALYLSFLLVTLLYLLIFILVFKLKGNLRDLILGVIHQSIDKLERNFKAQKQATMPKEAAEPLPGQSPLPPSA